MAYSRLTTARMAYSHFGWEGSPSITSTKVYTLMATLATVAVHANTFMAGELA